MYDTLKPRAPLTKQHLPNTQAYLAPHRLNPEQHPYAFDSERYDLPLPIPQDLSQQIASSKPPDGIR